MELWNLTAAIISEKGKVVTACGAPVEHTARSGDSEMCSASTRTIDLQWFSWAAVFRCSLWESVSEKKLAALYSVFSSSVFQVSMQAGCWRWKQSRKSFYPDKTCLWLRDICSEVMTPVGKQSMWEDVPVCRSEIWKKRGVGSCCSLSALTVNSDLENISEK